MAEDGHKLWLRYAQLEEPGSWRSTLSSIRAEGAGETTALAVGELGTGLGSMLGVPVALKNELMDGALVLGTPETSALVAGLPWKKELVELGNEGFLIRSASVGGKAVTVIASEGEIGCLYGAFHLLRLIATGAKAGPIDLKEKPRVKRRMLNHWDNLDGSIERGYAGKSLWKWDELPGQLDSRLTDYARANASLGINGVVLNNVNANPLILKPEYLLKVKALADFFRPWGLRVYLSANFGTPKAFGETDTADPMDDGVKKWWKKKASEIYSQIPDFGGFLVKANSEGQPGPLDYGRTHADGANMLAKALAPHHGIVIWRAFVYGDNVDRDRVKRAYLQLMPLDGKFSSNVFIQAKNGALDFQPREPFHPLFGGLKRSKIAAELQVTQEYLGQSTHLVYLGPMWSEFFNADSSSVAKAIDGSLFGHEDSLIAGVANTGSDANWCGHDFAQANWYSFGRLAWNPDGDAEALAKEWIAQTWTRETVTGTAILKIMMGSHQALVDYMSPLGLAGVYEKDNHYGPDPGMVDSRHDDWSAAYFTRADKAGLGYERSRRGSAAVDQYQAPLADLFDNAKTCPEEFLLWFHHLPWDARLKSGLSLWQELQRHFKLGVESAHGMQKDWEALKGQVDSQRHAAVLAKLKIQAKEAGIWADKSLRYYEDVMEGRNPGHPFGLRW